MTMCSSSDADYIGSDANFDLCQNYDNGDLRQDYDNAVDCIVQCDSIINNLQQQLASKDNHIAALEAKIVHMSLELALSKAFEDEHRGIRRTSRVPDYKSSDYDQPRSSELATGVKNQHIAPRRATVDVTAPSPMSRCTKASTAVGRHHQQRRCSLGGREDGSALDDSATTKTTCPLDESSLSTSCRLSINFDFGQLFGNKNRGNKLRDSTTSKETLEEEDTDDNDRQAQQRGRGGRRQSSRSFLDAVVFPDSFEEVLIKGCVESRSSLRNSVNSTKNEIAREALRP